MFLANVRLWLSQQAQILQKKKQFLCLISHCRFFMAKLFLLIIISIYGNNFILLTYIIQKNVIPNFLQSCAKFSTEKDAEISISILISASYMFLLSLIQRTVRFLQTDLTQNSQKMYMLNCSYLQCFEIFFGSY